MHQALVWGYVMSNYILKYKRDKRVKYISHLDFVRLFHRAVRRSGVDFIFSQGFNPHPVMTVAMPLSVGVTSDGEYMKVGFEDTFSTEEIKDRINSALPPGYEIVEIIKLKAKEIDLTKINRAEYTVEIENSSQSSFNTEEFLKNETLCVMKKTKSGVKESNIRPYIYNLELINKEGNVFTFSMCLACGSDYNLKPETVADAMEKYAGFKNEFVCIHRNSLILNK